MINTPLVSVILTSYNYARFISRAIESVLSQDFDNLELVIVEDASTDDSLSIIQKYATTDPRISIIKHSQNMGVFYTANNGIHHARGTYCVTLSADDFFLPSFLSRSLALLTAYPEYGLVFSDYGHFDIEAPEHIFSERILPESKEPILLTPIQFQQLQFQRTFWIPGHTTIVKRQLVQAYGAFDPTYDAFTDWVLYHTIALMHGAIYIPSTLAAFQNAPQSFKNQFNDDPKRVKRVYNSLLTKLLKQPALSKSFRKSCLLSFVFKQLFWKTILRPQYMPFFIVFARRKLQTVIAKSRHKLPH